jgi:hypothetical protein
MNNMTTNPARGGAERLLLLETVIRDLMAENSGKVPSSRRVSREMGLNDDRSIRAAWDKLAAHGRVPARPTRGSGTTPPARPAGGRSRSFNGKTNPGRQRELKDRKKTDNYLELLKFQLLVSQLSAVLEHINVGDYPLDEVGLWRVNDIHDDLLMLAPWLDRTLGQVTGWLGDADIRARIETLRNVSGRTPEEAKGFLKLADSLERKLKNRLISG